MHDLDHLALSRRGLLRGGAWLGAGAALSSLPFAQALAQTASADANWPSVAAMLDKYVGQRKVSGMVAALGWAMQRQALSAGARKASTIPTPLPRKACSAPIRRPSR